MKDPATDPDVIGYCGVLLTSHNEYQGFLITQQAEAGAHAMLTNARAMIRQGDPVGSVVENATPGVSAEDQPLVGTLCAALVDCWMTGKLLHVAAVAGALRLLLGRDHFWIMASSKPEGVSTTLFVLEAKTALEARAAFERQPPVMMTQMMRNLGKR